MLYKELLLDNIQFEEFKSCSEDSSDNILMLPGPMILFDTDSAALKSINQQDDQIHALLTVNMQQDPTNFTVLEETDPEQKFILYDPTLKILKCEYDEKL